MTLAEYEQLAEAQGGVCAVCQETNGASRLCIDHDHATNQIRGLLCYRCNTALGLLRDDPVLLVAAASYLTDGRQRAGFPD